MTDKRDIQKRIKSIRNRGITLDKDIHETGVACMIHARDHGDVTLLAELVEAMPKSGRRKALVKWASDHMPATFSEKTGQFKLKKNRTAEDFLVEKAEAVPFWDYTKERKPTEYDLQKAINAFYRSLKKAKEQGNLNASENTVMDEVRRSVHEIYTSA